jgi:hypothetical protein
VLELYRLRDGVLRSVLRVPATEEPIEPTDARHVRVAVRANRPAFEAMAMIRDRSGNVAGAIAISSAAPSGAHNRLIAIDDRTHP